MRQIKACMVLLTVLCFLPIFASAQTYRVAQVWDDDGNPHRPTTQILTIAGEEEIRLSSGDSVEADDPAFFQPDLPEYYKPIGPIISEFEDYATAVFINVYHPVDEFVVSNTLETGKLILKKTADVADAEDVFRFNLKAKGEFRYATTRGRTGTTAEEIRLHAGEAAIIEDIPIGTVYTVEEIDDPRYFSSGRNASGTIKEAETEVSFVNSLITTAFTVYKQWEGTARDSITLNLYADGELMPDIAFEKKGDAYIASRLPKYGADGHEILYSATEVYMSGYMTMYINKAPYENRSRAVYNGGTIVNREITSVSVRKKWIGADEKDRPEITFQLYQNGVPIVWRQPEKNETGWYIWENLPKMKDEELARYSVRELPVEGFQTWYENINGDVTDRALNGGTIINYRVPQTGDGQFAVTVLLIAVGGAGLLICILLLRKLRG